MFMKPKEEDERKFKIFLLHPTHPLELKYLQKNIRGMNNFPNGILPQLKHKGVELLWSFEHFIFDHLKINEGRSNRIKN